MLLLIILLPVFLCLFLTKVNSTVPIASEVYKKHGVYKPEKYDALGDLFCNTVT